MQIPERDIPIISAIIPIGNLHNKSRNLQTLLMLDLRYFEIILVLDDSDNYTLDLINSLKEGMQSGCTILVQGKFGNPGAARNAGAKVATCDWICFWDADDLPEPKSVLSILANYGYADILVGQYKILDWNNQKELSRKYPDLDRYSVAVNPGLWRHVFKRSLVSDVYFPELTMAEDQVYLASAYLKARVIVFSPLQVYNYFQNVPSQLTGRTINPLTLSKAKQEIANLMLLDVNSSNLTFLSILYLRQFFTEIQASPKRRLMNIKSEWIVMRQTGIQNLISVVILIGPRHAYYNLRMRLKH